MIKSKSLEEMRKKYFGKMILNDIESLLKLKRGELEYKSPDVIKVIKLGDEK